MFVIVGRHLRNQLAMACVCKVGRSVKTVCKQKRRGMICLRVEITSFMGAALVEV